MTHEPRWDSTYAVAFYVPAVLGFVGAWGTCRRRAAGRWSATALAVLTLALILRQATRAGTIDPLPALWFLGMPLVVLYTVHVAHRGWFRDGRSAA
jgi:hypothetical protein